MKNLEIGTMLYHSTYGYRESTTSSNLKPKNPISHLSAKKFGLAAQACSPCPPVVNSPVLCLEAEKSSLFRHCQSPGLLPYPCFCFKCCQQAVKKGTSRLLDKPFADTAKNRAAAMFQRNRNVNYVITRVCELLRCIYI